MDHFGSQRADLFAQRAVSRTSFSLGSAIIGTWPPSSSARNRLFSQTFWRATQAGQFRTRHREVAFRFNCHASGQVLVTAFDAFRVCQCGRHASQSDTQFPPPSCAHPSTRHSRLPSTSASRSQLRGLQCPQVRGPAETFKLRFLRDQSIWRLDAVKLASSYMRPNALYEQTAFQSCHVAQRLGIQVIFARGAASIFSRSSRSAQRLFKPALVASSLHGLRLIALRPLRSYRQQSCRAAT